MSHPSNAWHSIVHSETQSYLGSLLGAEDPLLDIMEGYASQRGFPLIGRQSGRWLELLTRLIGGRRVFELGSGWGYSAFFFARAVGEAGQVVGTELEFHELEAHARLYAGHDLQGRIHLQQGDAIELFRQSAAPWDVVFLDLHKEQYPLALALAAERLRPGGLLLADNVLWGGRTARPPESGDQATLALQRFNREIAQDPRWEALILPVGDGLTVARRREW
jgi:caffeoyl-CoA O-methyltransferase